jgi:hypothetical protein
MDHLASEGASESPRSTAVTKGESRRRLEVRRLVFDTKTVAQILGYEPDTLRRQCERKAVLGEDGEQVAHLDLGIVAKKRGGRWRFVVPLELLSKLEG